MDEQGEQPVTPASTGQQSTTGAAVKASTEIRVMSCTQCAGPVPSNADKCVACGFPVSGKEVPYIPMRPASPDINGMIKWWGIFSVAIFALGGFSFGIGSTLAFSTLTLVYGVRILRAYYS